MDIVFKCTGCGQELAVDASATGSEIECPTCREILLVPEATAENTAEETPAPPPPPPSVPRAPVEEAKKEKHFAVPQHSVTGETLIKKPKPSLEVAAKDVDKKLRIKTIRHRECQEVGKDRFDEIVTDFLQKIGEENIVAVHPITYSAYDVTSGHVLGDFGVVIMFKG